MNAEHQKTVIQEMSGQICHIAKTPEQERKIGGMVHTVQHEARRKEVIAIRKRVPIKKVIDTWKIWFVYGIHWKKTFYPIRVFRNIVLGKLYNLLGIQKYVLRELSLQ